jgi:hypothetical protein
MVLGVVSFRRYPYCLPEGSYLWSEKKYQSLPNLLPFPGPRQWRLLRQLPRPLHSNSLGRCSRVARASFIDRHGHLGLSPSLPTPTGAPFLMSDQEKKDIDSVEKYVKPATPSNEPEKRGGSNPEYVLLPVSAVLLKGQTLV